MAGNGEPTSQPGDTVVVERSIEGCANVIDVQVERDGETSDGIPTYRFDVTVQSSDLGWEKYADRWEVVDMTGRMLGERILTHPHETEQPFTRSQAGIPVDTDRVVVRAHDSVEGFCGADVELEVS
ncbi:MAG: hypothetical protein KJN81_02930 [Acidimicrobiia bacterium]|nr:hypothetical protein [Acidimicrobiia bacterium]NNL27363.1 hypothetical protein [Acidimicrobiia bacterium]